MDDERFENITVSKRLETRAVLKKVAAWRSFEARRFISLYEALHRTLIDELERCERRYAKRQKKLQKDLDKKAAEAQDG